MGLKQGALGQDLKAAFYYLNIKYMTGTFELLINKGEWLCAQNFTQKGLEQESTMPAHIYFFGSFFLWSLKINSKKKD